MSGMANKDLTVVDRKTVEELVDELKLISDNLDITRDEIQRENNVIRNSIVDMKETKDTLIVVQGDMKGMSKTFLAIQKNLAFFANSIDKNLKKEITAVKNSINNLAELKKLEKSLDEMLIAAERRIERTKDLILIRIENSLRLGLEKGAEEIEDAIQRGFSKFDIVGGVQNLEKSATSIDKTLKTLSKTSRIETKEIGKAIERLGKSAEEAEKRIKQVRSSTFENLVHLVLALLVGGVIGIVLEHKFNLLTGF